MRGPDTDESEAIEIVKSLADLIDPDDEAWALRERAREFVRSFSFGESDPGPQAPARILGMPAANADL